MLGIYSACVRLLTTIIVQTFDTDVPEIEVHEKTRAHGAWLLSIIIVKTVIVILSWSDVGLVRTARRVLQIGRRDRCRHDNDNGNDS